MTKALIAICSLLLADIGEVKAALPPELRAVMSTLCLDCHGAKKPKGNLDLHRYLDGDGGFASDTHLLEEVIEQVEADDMPPKKAKRHATSDERTQMLSALRGHLVDLEKASQDGPGSVLLSRLTKAQYDYVIHDLTGRDLHAARYFPDDVVAASGFNNAGVDLNVSPAHMDSYLSAARFVLSHALITPERGFRWFSEPASVVAKPEELRKALLTEWLTWHVDAESRALNERYDDVFEMNVAEKNALRFADYWEAAWRMKHGQTLAAAASEAKPPLVVPILRRWAEILSDPQPTLILGNLVEWFQKLPPPSAATLPAMRREAEHWRDRLMAHQKPIWNKRWFETRLNTHYLMNAPGPGEISEPAPGLGRNFTRLQKSPGYKASATYAYLEQARFELKVDLAKFSKRELVLVVTDAWDGPAGDEVLWHDMKFVLADGTEQPVPEVTLQAPAMRKLALPAGAISFTATVQLSERDKARASAQAFVLEREPTADEARLFPQRYVLTWPEGRERWEAGMSALLHLFARSGKAAEGKSSSSIYATDFLAAGAMPKLEDSKPEFPEGPYHLSQDELVECATPESRAARELLKRDLIAAAQLPLRDLVATATAKEKTATEAREGVIPVAWTAERKASAQQFIAAMTASARGQLGAFVRQAWRREVTPDELEHLTTLFAREYTNGASYDAAMKHPLMVVLVSPHFLYRNPALRVANRPAAGAEPSVTALSPGELASRLSFFLWSSAPDAALLDAAKSGHLDVQAQTARMLKDERIGALAEEFFGRWLHFYNFREWTAPDAERFPEFTPTLRQAMHEETRAFFTALLREDRPLSELARSKSVFVNEELARHYGIDGVKGAELREVAVGAAHRGGLLGMGSVLTRTSAPLRTSPVFRGKWIVETLLGRHIPPPPPNVKQISSDEKDDSGLTIAQQLANHRTDANCAACHAKIDPPGVALEQFDPIGRWRASYRGDVPITTNTELDGRPLAGLDGLRQFLTEHLDEVARTLCERLVEFGLGRRIEAGDAALRERMFTAMKQAEWRIAPAIEQLATSPQFTQRRATFASNK